MPTHRPYPYPSDSQRAASSELAPHLEELRAALIQQRCFRLEQLRELARMPVKHSPPDLPRDEVTACLRTAAAAALLDIEAALDRLVNGGYGRCEHCRYAIALERLEILPMARMCMRCQREKESRSPR
ncbi:MAG: TraR/DksA C4-type zinc finger protein [Jatrophihabitantaceae bacterium]